jgi:hypothetical protein
MQATQVYTENTATLVSQDLNTVMSAVESALTNIVTFVEFDRVTSDGTSAGKAYIKPNNVTKVESVTLGGFTG